MDEFDRHVLNFVLTWAPFGGHTDDEAFPEFGLSAHELWTRFAEVTAAAELQVAELGEWDALLVNRARQVLLTQRRTAG